MNHIPIDWYVDFVTRSAGNDTADVVPLNDAAVAVDPGNGPGWPRVTLA